MKIISFEKKHHKNGFTLLEALVVLFIISLLSTLILVNYQSNKKKYVLIQVNQRLISDIRRAQNMAISGTEIDGYCSEFVQCYGYGIYFDSGSSYVLFADQNGDKRYDNGEEFERINLPFSIIIQSVSPPATSIFFEPPEPITYINSSNDTGVFAEITLKIQGSSSNKKIRVNTAGLIENNNN